MVLQIKLYQLIEELMAGKTKVKSQILINDNDDSIAFEVNRKKNGQLLPIITHGTAQKKLLIVHY